MLCAAHPASSTANIPKINSDNPGPEMPGASITIGSSVLVGVSVAPGTGVLIADGVVVASE